VYDVRVIDWDVFEGSMLKAKIRRPRGQAKSWIFTVIKVKLEVGMWASSDELKSN